MLWLRVALVFVGAFLFLLGIGKTGWEIYSWGVLSQMGQRAPLVGNDPRVKFRLFLLVAALGVAIAAAGFLL